MRENLADPRKSARCNAGFIFGWSIALCENCPDYFFTSLPSIEENSALAMQQA